MAFFYGVNMSKIEIRTLHPTKDITKFIKFAWKIYKDDPNWVPPLMMDKKKLLNKDKNPFFKTSEMEMYMAYEDGEPVGRIAAIKNDTHNKIHNENIGFFGFFESINDQEVANALLDKAKEWLQSKGVNAMRGPANPSSNDEYGMLLEGFDDAPRIMMTYNPKYYLDLMDNYGIKKAKDLYAYRIDNEKLLKSEKLIRVAEIARKRSKVEIQQIDMKNFKNELERVKQVYNQAWAPNWGFIPMTEEEIDNLAKELKPIIEKSLVLFAEVDGKTIAFALVMLDYNELFKDFNGKLFPFNVLKLFTQRKKIKWARVLTLGIIPEYQKRGIDALLYYEIVKRAEKVGIVKGEASWILEDNEMMKRGAEVMNGEIYKKYRVYQQDI
jgi:GNAT superfamily N-acetyltransferase